MSLQFESLGPGPIAVCLVKSVAALSRYMNFCQNNPIACQVIFENAELAGLLKNMHVLQNLQKSLGS